MAASFITRTERRSDGTPFGNSPLKTYSVLPFLKVRIIGFPTSHDVSISDTERNLNALPQQRNSALRITTPYHRSLASPLKSSHNAAHVRDLNRPPLFGAPDP